MKSVGSIEFDAHLVLNAKGQMRLVKHSPSLNRGERSIAIKLTVPETFFNIPAITARISLPTEASAPEINAETIASIESALKSGTGAAFTISVSHDD